MKPNELRIGNLVAFGESILEVCLIEVDSFMAKDNENQTWKNTWADTKPIVLTEEWLLKLGFENWGEGKLYKNEYETYARFVLHNVIDGTSSFEVHIINSNYGNNEEKSFVISCDEDERYKIFIKLEYVHQLQNLYYSLTGEELILKND